jgi:signal transduction histidine kinase
VATRLVLDGRTVAVVAHASAVGDLEREIGAAIRLALENERLQAEVLSQLEDLRASRARIVEMGDEERRQLERDLHDGAQQRLLALSYDLRLARTGAEADHDVGSAAILAETTAEVQDALRELRELAHGIYPAILTEAGLAPAVATLVDQARLPVEIGDIVEDRYPAPVETAAYLIVVDALDDATERGASGAAVTASRDDARLVIEVQDDGSERASSMVHLADRVGALGGILVVQANTIRAEIPCG